jgi:hypothetical protein
MTNTVIFMTLGYLRIRRTTAVPFSPLHKWIRILVVYVVKISRGRWPEHPSGKTPDFIYWKKYDFFAPPSARRKIFKCAPPNLKSWIRPCYCLLSKTFHLFMNKVCLKWNLGFSRIYIRLFFPERYRGIKYEYKCPNSWLNIQKSTASCHEFLCS